MALSDGLNRALFTDRPLRAEAAELLRESVTVDMHCHPNALGGPHFPRLDPALPENMSAGGVDCGFFAARGDYPLIRRNALGERYEQRAAKPGELLQRTSQQLDSIVEAAKSGTFALARSPEEVRAAKKAGVPAAVLAIEGADPLEGDPARIQSLYERGVRVIQLLHFRINEIGDIQTASPKRDGLTAFGREAVKEMNRLGIVIDTAHCSPLTLHGVLAQSRQPAILSHTGPSALRKHSRHLNDDSMLALAKRNGVVGVWPAVGRRGTFEHFLQAIDYVKGKIGVDHVGIGTDGYGIRGTTALPSHKAFPLIAAGLLRRRYAESEVAKIVGGNCMRVFDQVKETRS